MRFLVIQKAEPCVYMAKYMLFSMLKPSGRSPYSFSVLSYTSQVTAPKELDYITVSLRF